MPVPLTTYGIDPADLITDVYFCEDYLALHAHGRQVVSVSDPEFRHGAAVLPIPDAEQCDLETPWGYGGPVAANTAALSRGVTEWRRRQREAGRVAEFIRFHPFANPMAMRDLVEMLAFNRLTVVVDLEETEEKRWKHYSDSTRNCLRKAERNVTLRVLAPEEWPLFKALYEAGLKRNAAARSYYLDETFFQTLLDKPWCRTWVAEDSEGPIAVSSFLSTGAPVCHYHLSGGNDRSRSTYALYLLLQEAFRYYAQAGCRLMHLGGGRTTLPEDPLLAFKAKFSHLRVPFYVGGLVYDPVAYSRLGGGHGRFLCTGAGTLNRSPPPKHGPVSIRALKPGRDFADFFALKCDPNNISWTGFDSPPSWTGLKDFVSREVETGRRKILIVEHADKAVGYLYAQRIDGYVETAIGIAVDSSGRGIGRQALAQLANQLAGNPEWPPPYTAWICPDNRASIIAHEAAGYRLDRDTPPREVAGFEQRRWEWRQVRKPSKDG